VALINFALLAFFMRRRLGSLEGRKLGLTFVKVCGISVAMAAVAWTVSAQVQSFLSLRGFVLYLVQVTASMASAAIIFYLGCWILRVGELDDAVAAIAGPLIRRMRRFRSKPRSAVPE
jgi:peptidoglycan biosynthesis protein MviN/MurJ (putative lipid II flippase)